MCPLNIIQKDQLDRLTGKGIPSCRLDTRGHVYCAGEEQVAIDRLASGEFELIFTHPEAFDTTQGKWLLQQSLFCSDVLALVVDEAHVVINW